MTESFVTAYVQDADAIAAAGRLADTVGAEPKALVFFHSPNVDGRVLRAQLCARYPQAQVIGASSCGEYTETRYAKGGVAALAIRHGGVRRCASALATFEDGVAEGIRRAVGDLNRQLGVDLRELDPRRFVGLVLVEGTKMNEETVNHALGAAAPLLSFVGGSAGDNIAFERSWVHQGHGSSDDGAALMVLEAHGPFHVLKTASYRPGRGSFTVTRADRGARIVHELDGKPAADVYAQALDRPRDSLDLKTFVFNPVAVMIGEEAWLRSVVAVTESGGLFFACEMVEGMRVELMERMDIVRCTADALRAGAAAMGQPAHAGLFFDCVYRMLEVEALGCQQSYAAAVSGFPVAGMHTHGESWLGHINHTLTGLLFG